MFQPSTEFLDGDIDQPGLRSDCLLSGCLQSLSLLTEASKKNLQQFGTAMDGARFSGFGVFS